MPTALRRQSFLQRRLLLTNASCACTHSRIPPTEALRALTRVSEPKRHFLLGTIAFPDRGAWHVLCGAPAPAHTDGVSPSHGPRPHRGAPRDEPAHGDARSPGFQCFAPERKAAAHALAAPSPRARRARAKLPQNICWVPEIVRCWSADSVPLLSEGWCGSSPTLSHATEFCLPQRGLPTPQLL